MISPARFFLLYLLHHLFATLCFSIPPPLLQLHHGVYTVANSLVYVGSNAADSGYGYCNITETEPPVRLRKIFSELNITNIPFREVSIIPRFSNTECRDIVDMLDGVGQKRSDTLLIFTTCNHLDFSILALNTLQSSPDSFDIIVIDDYSVDGTPDYLMKKGYAVIRKEKALGLTHSWNIGYRIAKLRGYTHAIFANNDVLVPHGAIDIIRNDLQDECLVVPLSTRRGSGHNPSQDMALAHNLQSEHMQWYINNAQHFQLIQDGLTSLYPHTSRTKILSKWKKVYRFNGFFFAVNLNLIRDVAFDENHLFDPYTIMVDQENRLMAAMLKYKLYPKICLFAYVYHFKSVTVKAANHETNANEETRDNLLFYHPELNGTLPSLKRLPALYDDYFFTIDLPAAVVLPRTPRRLTVAITVSAIYKNPYAADIAIAKAFSKSLKIRYNVDIVFLIKGNWYDLCNVDILFNMHVNYDLTKIEHAKPTLVLVAWMVNSFDKWMSLPWLGNYDVLLASSRRAVETSAQNLTTICHVRCPQTVAHVLSRSTPIVHEMLLASDEKKRSPEHTRSEYSLLGSGNTERNSLLVGTLRQYEFAGSWHSIANAIPKVLVDDVSDSMRHWGGLNNVVFDAIMKGTLPITSDLIGAKEAFGTMLPTFKTIEELSHLVHEYMGSESTRVRLVEKLQKHIAEHHTYKLRAAEFVSYLPRRIASLIHASAEPLQITDTELNINPPPLPPSIYVGILLKKGTRVPRKLVSSLIKQFKQSELHSSHNLRILMTNIHNDIPNTTLTAAAALAVEYRSLPKIDVGVLVDVGNFSYDETSFQRRSFQDNILLNIRQKIGLRRQDDDDTSMGVTRFDPESDLFFTLDAADRLIDRFRQHDDCAWLMTTMSDTNYNWEWLRTVNKYMKNKTLSVIAWDYIAEKSSIDASSAAVRVALEQDRIGLGGGLIRCDVMKKNKIRHLSESVLTKRLESRISDVFADVASEGSVHLIHELLQVAES